MTTITGGAGNDTLTGSAGPDLLSGGEGNDRLVGITDGDTLDGGAGFDTVVIVDNGATPTLWRVDLATGEFSGLGQQGRAHFVGIESVKVEALYSSKASGWLVGNELDNRLEGTTVMGGRGNDTLVGQTVDYSDTAEPIRLVLDRGRGLVRLGDETDDITAWLVLRLGAGDDEVSSTDGGTGVLEGGAGNDRLTALTLRGGAGDDTLEGSQLRYDGAPGAVFVVLDEGGGVVTGAEGRDVVIGRPAVIGSEFGDRMAGSSGADHLEGRGGADTLDGGAGNDTLVGGSGSNHVAGGDGDDLLSAQIDASTLDGGAGDDRFEVYFGGHRMHGGDGDDRFLDAGGNTIEGGAGYDRVNLLGPPGVAVTVNLQSGRFSYSNGLETSARSIEELVLPSHVATVVAPLGGSAADPGLVVRHWQNPLAVFGGAGLDTVVFTTVRRGSAEVLPGPLAGYGVASLELRVPNLSDFFLRPTVHRLDNVERLLFQDAALAFGERALAVAEVAFALWSPAVANQAGSPALFGKGIAWYDNGRDGGRSRTELVEYALSWFAGLSNAELAAQLDANVASTRWDAAGLLALMNAQGGGAAGRAEAVRVMVDDAANQAVVAATGLARDGIACALFFAGEALFPVLPG